MIVRLIVSLLLILLSLWGCYRALCDGLAGTIARYAPETEFLQTAIELSPNNPKLHYLLGQAYLYDPDNINPRQALALLIRATELSPNDYQLWLVRAQAEERVNELAAAETSLREAVKQAPNYLEPHWQLANLLIRAGKMTAALPELRQALTTNSQQLPYALELIWQLSDADLRLTESILPANPTAEMEYLRLLLRKTRYRDAASYWQQLPMTVRNANSVMARQLIEALIVAADYDLAFDIWRVLPEYQGLELPKGKIHNGDFKQPLEQRGAGFEWQFDNTSTLAKLSVDTTASQPNGYSLSIDYTAEGNPTFDHIRQIVIVEPGHQYRLRYFARSKELVGGALPVVEITDAAGRAPLMVGSQPAILGSVDWRQFEVSFKVEAPTRALLIAIRRHAQCVVEGPCPIFGRVWFANFVLEEVR
ncbi:MAG: tetratricopeptide repeat protein [Acidobacteriota bacterium]